MSEASDAMQDMLSRFTESFLKAITAEMHAMRERMGPFEVPISGGKALDFREETSETTYRFDIVTPNDKLVPHAECTLAYEGGESLVTITGLENGQVTFTCGHEIRLDGPSHTLVIYPWFLYDKLKSALASLGEMEGVSLENAFRLFGKITPSVSLANAALPHHGMNGSQMRAVQLCAGSDLTFVWGPPGTGKTTTLAHIVTELMNSGLRILVTSTTNAAVDQALARLAALDETTKALELGQIVRVGQAHGDTFGAGLAQVVARLNAHKHERLRHLRKRMAEAARQVWQCDMILEKLAANSGPIQHDLFEDLSKDPLTTWDLGTVFSDSHADQILGLPPAEQAEVVERRRQRFQTVHDLCREKISEHTRELQTKESAVVRRARVVLATMTNVYMSRLLQEERFDVVIVEEAGMAVLPTLFYCACLAKAKLIMVGDPKQLPPIVQSREQYVRKAMGRSIFDVTVPDPHNSDAVVMLDTQYRMHPSIGQLVSALFYDGRLNNAESTQRHESIAARKPFGGLPIIVVDTQSRTICQTSDGAFSRFNESSAGLCVRLAHDAILDGIESVAIITPYVEQSRLIRRLLSQARIPSDRVSCHTVHRFQGNERDMVILDTVDARPMLPGILLSDKSPGSSAANLVNVSISRARGKLVIVSDVEYFETNAPDSIVCDVIRHARQCDGLVRTPTHTAEQPAL